MYIYKRVVDFFLEVYDKKVHSHHYVISQYVILNNIYNFFFILKAYKPSDIQNNLEEIQKPLT